MQCSYERNLKKYLLFIFLLLFLIIFLSGCSSKQEYLSEYFLMDTIIRIKVYDENLDTAKTAAQAAFEEFKRISLLTDRFPQKGTPEFNQSDICKINEMAGIKPVKVSEDVIKMIDLAKKYNKITDGAFDVTIGPLMDLWGFGNDNNYLPSDAEITQKLSLIDSNKIKVNRRGKTILLKDRGMSLDLGGIAKGYATEKAVQILKQHGIKQAIIDAGGNIYVLGKKNGKEPWKLGIQDPRDASKIVGILSLSNKAAVTSGDYQRFFEKNGARYHHILDPSTGKPARNTISVTVVSESPTVADILSTALFVMGPKQGMKLVEELRRIEAVFITPDKKIIISSGLKDKITVQPGKDYSYDPNG